MFCLWYLLIFFSQGIFYGTFYLHDLFGLIREVLLDLIVAEFEDL